MRLKIRLPEVRIPKVRLPQARFPKLRLPSVAQVSSGMSSFAFSGLALALWWGGPASVPPAQPPIELVKVKRAPRAATKVTQPFIPWRPADQDDRIKEAARQAERNVARLAQQTAPRHGKESTPGAADPTSPPAPPQNGSAGVPGKTEPAPTAVVAEPPPPPTTWSQAEIIEGLQACLRLLSPIGAEIEIAEPVRDKQCGAAAPVMLRRIRTKDYSVEFRPAPEINCKMVAGLHRWIEGTLQPAAIEMLGSPITRITGAGAYSCRNRYGLAVAPISEHAFANAVDLSGFVTADGRTIEVEKEWGPTVREIKAKQQQPSPDKEKGKDKDKTPPPEGKASLSAARESRPEPAKASVDQKFAKTSKEGQRSGLGGKLPIPESDAPRGKETESIVAAKTVEANFLRRLHRGACDVFGTVLGPEANEAHRNHFHFDMAARRRKSFCE